jgi:hypothetical protein
MLSGICNAASYRLFPIGFLKPLTCQRAQLSGI